MALALDFPRAFFLCARAFAMEWGDSLCDGDVDDRGSECARKRCGLSSDTQFQDDIKLAKARMHII